MHLPNYKDGSIVNLMSSIRKIYGGKPLYRPLKDFDISGLSNKNIVLLIIDGLGYEFLAKYGKGSFSQKNLKGKMTSVFPATTASAMTSFMTGVAPQQHAFTGWFMYLKEIGLVSAVLPFKSRAGGFRLKEGNIDFREIYEQKSFFEDLGVPSRFVISKEYADSDYSRLTKNGAKTIPFSDLDDFFQQVKRATSRGEERKFVVAYWDKLDAFAHEEGPDSKKAVRHFNQLDKRISKMARDLKGANAAIIVTADHGLIEGGLDKLVDLKDHPEFRDMLALPLSGDARVAYCYVRPAVARRFEAFIKKKFNKYCEICRSEELVKRGFFGLFEANEKLKDRIGDYVLIMKERYWIKDCVLGEERHNFIGHHGGVSKDEMYVPLVVIH